MSLRVSTSMPERSACSGLMYSGVPTNWWKPVYSVRSVRRCAGGLGHAEVDDLGHRGAVDDRHQDVGGLQVAMDDPLLVGVLHGPADQDEQLQPIADRELLAVAVVGDRECRGPAP